MFAPKCPSILSHFYKTWHCERVPGLLPHAQFHRCHFRIVGVTFKIVPHKLAIRDKSP